MTIVSKSHWLIFLPLFFCQPQRADAHDGWVEVSPSIVEKGQVATISLLHGNHSNERFAVGAGGK